MAKKEFTYSFYVNGERVDRIPDDVLDRMAENLGQTMSTYYTAHPEEYKKITSKEGNNP